MSAYVYYEGCGFESEPFDAAGDAAAVEHVMATFRSPANSDFDGDEGGIARIERDEDGEHREPVTQFAGENMIADPFGERRAYDGMGNGAWH